MREPIESEYFNWLCAKVLTTRGSSYIDLLRMLHQTEFEWLVLGDKNRAEDGRELRYEFLRMSGWEEDSAWFNEPCSVLEMLIAFSIRASFQTDTPYQAWFWEFLANLDLDEHRQVSGREVARIQEILYLFVTRQYDPSGYGGMFPLRTPQRDQREVEIWYQFCDYLEDRGLI